MEMSPQRLKWLLLLWSLLAWFSGVHLRSPSCHEVRTAFQLRQIGPLNFVPDFPGRDGDLQICTYDGPTCCTKKMEERYQVMVRREILQNIHFLSYELKYRIEKNGEAFQGRNVLANVPQLEIQ
ncbi:hypothetical protein scyTo_0012675 [Scyliorhinus torazame]|uniref:Glypican-1 n=1 Tax=Scyliorhinus torazame TaxID=75743 RepID=A0A401NGM8_SCYTO|nr:hypothetical protein [Scyliorhinus torazame]